MKLRSSFVVPGLALVSLAQAFFPCPAFSQGATPGADRTDPSRFASEHPEYFQVLTPVPQETPVPGTTGRPVTTGLPNEKSGKGEVKKKKSVEKKKKTKKVKKVAPAVAPVAQPAVTGDTKAGTGDPPPAAPTAAPSQQETAGNGTPTAAGDKPTLSTVQINEGKTQGSLGALMAALTIYHGDKGAWPEKVEDIVPTYIDKIPMEYISNSDQVYMEFNGQGGWYLDKTGTEYRFRVNLNGQDSKGVKYYDYGN